MSSTIIFPSELRAGTLFLAERCYCLDSTMIEYFADASGTVMVPDLLDTGQKDEVPRPYIGIIFKDNVPLRREVLNSLDPSLIQLVFFHNPFELTSLLEIVTADLTQLLARDNRAPDDEECELIGKLSGLKALDMAGARMSDKGLLNICKLTSLESLIICDTEITDEGVSYLASLTNLRELDLSLNAITSQSLNVLENFSNLEELRLSDTTIGDECIVQLSKLANLKYLDLADTAISDRGMELLRASLPECDVWP